MFKSYFFLLATLSVTGHVVLCEMPDVECDSVVGTEWQMNLSIRSRKDQNGEWITSFSACKDYSNTSRSFGFDVKQKVIRVGGKHIVHIKGVLKDVPHEDDIQRLKFFHKGCSRAVITNDGMTAFRENPKIKDFACVSTNRPLKNNELFEVRVDNKIDSIPGWPMGIGVTTHLPTEMQSHGWLGELKSETWILYDKTIMQHGVEINTNYGKGFQNLKPGDKVGVMKTEAGKLHFFINGVDLGVAASEIPYPVYGVVDLIRNIAQVTISEKPLLH